MWKTCEVCGRHRTQSTYGVCVQNEACRLEYQRRRNEVVNYTQQAPTATDELKTRANRNGPTVVCAACGKPGQVGPLGVCNRDTCKHELYRRKRLAAEKAVADERVARATARTKAFHEVLAHYGASCACCGSVEFLCIDHVDGDGKRHRKEILKSNNAAHFHAWLKAQGWPPGFQTLCTRCNVSKGRAFTCAIHDYKFLGPEELRFYFEQRNLDAL